jgi:hypothetical protein
MQAVVKRLLVVLMVLAFIAPMLVSGGAHAQDPTRAKALFDEARQLHEDGRTAEALDKLREAYEAYPAEAILVTIANRHIDLGQPEEAAEVLSRIEDRSLKKQVDKLRKQVEAQLAKPVTVQLSGDPDGATVSIDNGRFRRLPATVQLDRGRHRFVFRADGRKEVEMDKEVKGTKPMEVFVSLPAPPGSWRVAIEPEAPLRDVRIVFNGQNLALDESEHLASVTAAREAKPGRYKIICLRGMDEFVSTTVDVASGAEATATCYFDSGDSGGGAEAGGHAIAKWSTLGAGALGIVVGTILLVSYADDVDTYPEPRYEISSSKPAVGGLAVGLGVASGIVSGLMFGNVF